jgi:hypothetical protein
MLSLVRQLVSFQSGGVAEPKQVNHGMEKGLFSWRPVMQKEQVF